MDGADFQRRMAVGDIGVWDELSPEIVRIAKRLCFRMGIPDEYHQDIGQDVAERVFRKWETYRGGSLPAWITRIASNVCKDHLARKRAEARVFLPDAPLSADDPDGLSVIDVQPDPATPSVLWQLCIHAMLIELAEQHSVRGNGKPMIEVLEWCVKNAPTSEELAAFLGTTDGAARERKRYIVERVRELCRKHCGNDDCQMEE